MKTSELIKKAEELLAKCSDGPWDYKSYDICAANTNKYGYRYDENNVEIISPIVSTECGRYGPKIHDRKFIIFARNHMQELIDKLKKYESALKTIGEFNNEDFSDPSVDMASFANKALGDE